MSERGAMGNSYRIRSNLALATFRIEGILTMDGGVDLFMDYMADAAFDPCHTMLTDARGVTRVEATFLGVFARVMRLAPQMALFRSPVLAVILVPDQTAFGYARMVEQVLDMTTNIRLRPVWTEAEVMGLLDRPGLDFGTVFAAQP